MDSIAHERVAGAEAIAILGVPAPDPLARAVERRRRIVELGLAAARERRGGRDARHAAVEERAAEDALAGRIACQAETYGRGTGSKVGGNARRASSGTQDEEPMAILVVGANGFIGRHVARALEQAGFEVVHGVRPGFDFNRDLEPATWEARLGGIDTVVNAVGIFRELPGQGFDNVHFLGPRALFLACATQGVKVIQLSALGADEGARSRFHLTKKQADDVLHTIKVRSTILQPSLVYGAGGASARLFATLATLPWIPLPGAGEQPVQPVHVDDLAEAVVQTVRTDRYPGSRLAVVGPEPTTLKRFLTDLRHALGIGGARYLFVPRSWVAFFARLGDHWRGAPLDSEAWGMLERGNTADATPLRALIGRELRAPVDFVDPNEREGARLLARLGWLLPILRITIAIVWLVAGVVSAAIYPVDESMAMLERVGITGGLATLSLYGAAAFDFAMGIATLAMRRRQWLWIVQALAILAYTAIITVALPEQWLHPFGPVVKNLPMLAAIWLLYEAEKR